LSVITGGSGNETKSAPRHAEKGKKGRPILAQCRCRRESYISKTTSAPGRRWGDNGGKKKKQGVGGWKRKDGDGVGTANNARGPENPQVMASTDKKEWLSRRGKGLR